MLPTMMLQPACMDYISAGKDSHKPISLTVKLAVNPTLSPFGQPAGRGL